jgi:hypothetical protein
MRRGLKVYVLFLAALALAAIAIVAPGPAPAQAGTGFPVYLGEQGINCALHGHAHGDHITVTCNQTIQAWAFVNGQRWTNPDGQIVHVSELRLAGTNWCVNFTPVDYNFYLNNCVAGDANELFWVTPSDPRFDYWFINAAASMATHENYYMTAVSFTNNAIVVAAGQGAGNRAVWHLPY